MSLHVLRSEVLHIASSRSARRKHNLMVLDGRELVTKALSSGVELNAIYCSRVKDVSAKLSANIIASGGKLFQLTGAQIKLARQKGIVSSIFGNCTYCFLAAVA